jgi:hypothetical protein
LIFAGIGQTKILPWEHVKKRVLWNWRRSYEITAGRYPLVCEPVFYLNKPEYVYSRNIFSAVKRLARGTDFYKLQIQFKRKRRKTNPRRKRKKMQFKSALFALAWRHGLPGTLG